VREQLTREISEAQATSWLRTVEAFWLRDGALMLQAQSHYGAQLLDLRYGDRIAEVARRVLGNVEIEIRSAPKTRQEAVI
jgi:chromosomal replication initiation ATPase DnaA